MKLKNVLYLLSFFTPASCISDLSAAEKLSSRWPEMVEQLTQRKFDNSKAVDEMSRERSENRIPFTMNFKGCEGKPVLKADKDREIYLQLDSASTGMINNKYEVKYLKNLEIFVARKVHFL